MDTSSLMPSCMRNMMLMIALTQFAAASEPFCNVQVEQDKCTYHVQMPPPPPVECDCESWNNATDFVLADCNGKSDGLVVSNTDTSLVTSKCIKIIIYKRNCKEDYFEIICTANCTSTKSEAVVNHNNKGDRTYIGTQIAIGLVVLVLLSLLVLQQFCAGERGWLKTEVNCE